MWRVERPSPSRILFSTSVCGSCDWALAASEGAPTTGETAPAGAPEIAG